MLRDAGLSDSYTSDRYRFSSEDAQGICKLEELKSVGGIHDTRRLNVWYFSAKSLIP